MPACADLLSPRISLLRSNLLINHSIDQFHSIINFYEIDLILLLFRNVSKINYLFFLLNYNQSLRYFFVTTPCVAPQKCLVID